MHDTYRRLLEAAATSTLKATTPAEISRRLTENGCDVSAQMIGNWKSRGIPYRVRDDICRVFKVIKLWLDTGEGPMRGLINSPPEVSGAASELVSLFFALDELEQKKLMAKLRYKVELLAIEEQKQISQAEPKNKRASA